MQEIQHKVGIIKYLSSVKADQSVAFGSSKILEKGFQYVY